MIKLSLSLVGLEKTDSHIKTHDTPAINILAPSSIPKPCLQKWNYCFVARYLSYIQDMICPDIAFSVQKCARFCHSRTQDHEEAIKRICRYLLRINDKGLIIQPNKKKGLECYVDADWTCTWTFDSSFDPLSNHSRTCFVILYAGCTILWNFKFQLITALSPTEAEYINLSSALCEVITIIQLLENLQHKGLPIHCATPKVRCRTFE